MRPRALEERPLLKPRCKLYYEAFVALSGSRPVEEGRELPITMSDIKAYLDLVEECGAENRLQYLRYIQRMDAKYIEHRGKKAEILK